jgi:hypothetical protein
MFERLGRAVTGHPWLVIVGWLVAAGAIVLLAPGLGAVTNADQTVFLPSGAESARAAALAARDLPAESRVTAVIVVVRPGGELSDGDVATVARLAGGAGHDPGGDAGLARPAGVTGITFDPATGVAANRRAALVVVGFAGPAERADTQADVAALRRDVAGALAGTGLSAGITGQAAVVVDNKQAFGHATAIVAVATLALIVLLLLLIFRSPVAALLPLLTVGVVYAVTSGLVALGARTLHVQVGQELPTMLTVVLFGIGTDYVLFLLFRYRERLRAGQPPDEAVVAAVGRVGEAVACAALAVIAAFGALVLAVLGFFRTLGPALAVGVAVMLLAALTLVPALLRVLGRFAFWPAAAAQLAGAAPSQRLSAQWPRAARVFPAVGRLVGRRPGLVLAGGVLLLGTAASGLVAVHPSYDPIRQLPSGTESGRAFAQLSAGFPAGALSPTTVYLHGDAPLSRPAVTAFMGRLAAATTVLRGRSYRGGADRAVRRAVLVGGAEPGGRPAAGHGTRGCPVGYHRARRRPDDGLRRRSRGDRPRPSGHLPGGGGAVRADPRRPAARAGRAGLPGAAGGRRLRRGARCHGRAVPRRPGVQHPDRAVPVRDRHRHGLQHPGHRAAARGAPERAGATRGGRAGHRARRPVGRRRRRDPRRYVRGAAHLGRAVLRTDRVRRDAGHRARRVRRVHAAGTGGQRAGRAGGVVAGPPGGRACRAQISGA